MRQPDEASLERYRGMQQYVDWSQADAQRVHSARPLVEPEFGRLIEDFYWAIEQNPRASRVITGGPTQVERLKRTLRDWLRELFSGEYDQAYLERRWQVGWRHVEIGLESFFTNIALSRLRSGIAAVLRERWTGHDDELAAVLDSFHKLLDLDLAIIQDAYETEFLSRQERAVRHRSEAAFRRLVESAGSMIVLLRRDGTIAYINPYTEELTGFGLRAVQGKPYLDQLVRAEERREVSQSLAAVWSGLPQRGFAHAIRCHDHSSRLLLWNAQRLDDFEGDEAVLAIGHDVTEQKRAEERALQAERLAAIGETVTGLAHESRNAFQRSQACLELLELELKGQPDQLELVGRVQRALDHLHRLYEEVRDYAAPIMLDRQRCDLSHLWRDAWAHLEADRKEKQLQLVESWSTDTGQCQCDWFAMGQVFRNVLENAIASSPADSKIFINCSETELDGQPALHVSVRDQGRGIADDIRSRVFDAFFTTRTKGTGLGMAIAKRIVEAHRGEIGLANPPEGAEFRIVIPQ